MTLMCAHIWELLAGRPTFMNSRFIWNEIQISSFPWKFKRSRNTELIFLQQNSCWELIQVQRVLSPSCHHSLSNLTQLYSLSHHLSPDVTRISSSVLDRASSPCSPNILPWPCHPDSFYNHALCHVFSPSLSYTSGIAFLPYPFALHSELLWSFRS